MFSPTPRMAPVTPSPRWILIKPWPTHRNPNLGDDQFHRDDYMIDYVARTVTCPNGITTHLSVNGTATFGVKCRGCPVRSRCTSATAGKSFTVGEHDQLLAANRTRWSTDTDLVDDYRQHRPMVERSIAWLIANGHRRCRHRGVDSNRLALSIRAATINLRRLLNLGLDWSNGWQLAT